MILTLFSLLLSGAEASSWCSYDCGSISPAVYGAGNLGDNSGLPNPLGYGYNPISSLKLCGDNEYSPLLQPQISAYNIIVFCPNGDGFSVAYVNENKTLEVQATVSLGMETLSFRTYGRYVAVNTGSKLHVLDSKSLTPLTIASLPDTTFKGLPFATYNSIYSFTENNEVVKFGYDIVEKSEAILESQISTSGTHLEYMLIDAEDNVYTCQGNTVQKYALEGPASFLTETTLPAACASLVLPSKGLLYVAAGSSIYELDTATLSSQKTLLSVDDDIVFFSRLAWKEVPGRRSLVAVQTTSSIYVFTDENDFTERGVLLRSTQFIPKETSTGLSPQFALASKGDILVHSNNRLQGIFEEKPIISFTSSEAGWKRASPVNFVGTPLMLGNVALVSTTEGEIVAHNWCRRWKIGGTQPERNACPVPDLPSADDLPVAALFTASAAAGVVIAPLVSLFLSKSKLGQSIAQKLGLKADEEEDMESDSENDDLAVSYGDKRVEY